MVKFPLSRQPQVQLPLCKPPNIPTLNLHQLLIQICKLVCEAITSGVQVFQLLFQVTHLLLKLLQCLGYVCLIQVKSMVFTRLLLILHQQLR